MSKSRADMASEMKKALFEALVEVARSHGVVLPDRGTPEDIERSFAALAGVRNYKSIYIKAEPGVLPRISIQSAWGDKIGRIEELGDEINNSEFSVRAELSGNKLDVFCVE